MNKILMVNEASFLRTGYAVYGKEVLSRLHNAGYEVAELATYCGPDDERLSEIPWKVYPNIPGENDPDRHTYNSESTHQFGEFSFERVCLDFQPDIVFDIRDYWMFEHEERSPYRPHFKWAIMPTVDSIPQQEQWMSTYQSADAVLTYQDWSGNALIHQSGGKIDWRGSASPAAASVYRPAKNRDELKTLLGLGPDVTIIGTVMRNQRRKLYPELFKAFRKFLDRTKRKDVVLYCHTSFPDNGWDIPYLIKEFGLSSKVFFTYTCDRCQFAFPTTFQDALTHCRQCNSRAAHLVSVQRGVEEDVLAMVLNMFDLYVQYSVCEGFGMPMVEAASCGTPIAAVDYSAMSDVVRRVGGYPIPLKMLYREMETGCDRAYPDEDKFVEILEKFCTLPKMLRDKKREDTRSAVNKHYSWDKTAEKWMEVFDSLSRNKSDKGWEATPRIVGPEDVGEFVNYMDNAKYARWLIDSVLGEQERQNTFFESRIIRDLNYGVHLKGMSGLYFNEQAHMFERPKYEVFNRDIAYQEMVGLNYRRNLWEQRRKDYLNLRNG